MRPIFGQWTLVNSPRGNESGTQRCASRVTVLARAAALIAALMFAGCPPPPKVAEVTGVNSSDTTYDRDQSETSLNVSNLPGPVQIISVAYNDETGTEQTIVFGPTTRHVSPGASMMGWSYSTDGGQTWVHGGKLAPPAGWSVLWGDPSMASDSFDPHYVFMGNLAVPASKMPATGIDGDLTNYMGGACIARSQDGGKTFQVAQCVSNNSDFYDGSTMVTGGNLLVRSVFAAFRDVYQNRIDVWMSVGDTGQFNLLPNPFPNIPIGSHPRLRYDPDTQSLYVAALGYNDNKVYVNRYVGTSIFGIGNSGGAWGAPVVASITTAGNPDIQLSDRVVRTGYQFSFDVGSPSSTGAGDEVRFAYTAYDQTTARYYIRGSYCSLDLKSACIDVPQWGTTPGNFNIAGDQFHPYVRAFRGVANVQPVWKLAYTTREDAPTGNTLSFREGNLAALAGGAHIFLPFSVPTDLLACPDNRGYYGDYNDLQFAGIDGAGKAQFMLTFTDSSKGCLTMEEYNSHHVHVTSAVF